MMDLTVMGARMKAERDKRGLSLRAVAAQCGVSRDMMGKYERGRHAPNSYIMAMIADYYGVSMEYLCGVEEHGEKVVFFDTEEQLQAMTGLDHNWLWDAGFDLDDWDWGFVADREWTEDWGKIVPEYEWWMIAKMENHCVGYRHVEYKGKHYYMQYHA